MIERSNRWEFYQDRLKLWQWRKFQGDKVVSVSMDSFPSFKECVGNATQKGYVAPLPATSRLKKILS
jgi:hypothetical protein